LHDDKGNPIGCADSNGDVYDEDSAYIGKVSNAKYAYGFDGKILGEIDQTGSMILPDGKSVYVSINNLIMDRGNRVYGYAVPDINVFVDSSGKKVGHLFVDGLVYDQTGAVIDIVNSGSEGYYNGTAARNIRPEYVVDAQGNVLGKVNYDLSVVDHKGKIVGRVNTKGQMFDDKGHLVGGTVQQGSVRGYNGVFLGYVVSTGKVVELENLSDGEGKKYKQGEVTGRIIPDGHVTDGKRIVGEVSPDSLMIDVYGNPIGLTNSYGMIVGTNRKVISSILPGGGNNNNLVTAKSGLVINSAGEIIGTAVSSGEYLDTKHIVAGKVLPDGKVISGNGKFLGEIISGDIVIGNDDTVKGIVGFDGKVYSGGNVIGKILTDNLAVDTKNNIIGHVYAVGSNIVSNDGNYIGRLAANGRVISGQNEEVGYIKSNGSFVDMDKNVSGYVLPEVARNRRN
jgi:hypothetical protein